MWGEKKDLERIEEELRRLDSAVVALIRAAETQGNLLREILHAVSHKTYPQTVRIKVTP